MTAFVRFRRVEDDGRRALRRLVRAGASHPRRVAPFFVDRFAAHALVDPDAARRAALGRPDAVVRPGACRREQAPHGDDCEDWWRTYYRSTFNPARANPTMQRAEMPKKYWRNLPEAPLIPALLREARGSGPMRHARAPTPPRRATRRAGSRQRVEPPAAGTLDALARGQSPARAARSGSHATQTVFGEGPAGRRRDVRRRAAGRSGGSRRAGRSSARPARCSTARSTRPASTARASTSPTR